MKFKLISDIHQDYLLATNQPFWFPEETTEDRNTVLLIAGDYYCWNRERPATEKAIFKPLNERYHTVVYVPGNHEFYGSDINTCVDKIEYRLKQYENIIVLDNAILDINGVNIIGSTLWGGLEGGDPISMINCKKGIADFHEIYTNTELKLFTPQDMYNLYLSNREFIEKALQEHSPERTILLTHHLPMAECIDFKFLRSRINGAFVGDISDLVLKYQPRYSLFGHTHDSVDLQVGNTRVVCSPRGYYPHEQNSRFSNGFDFYLGG